MDNDIWQNHDPQLAVIDKSTHQYTTFYPPSHSLYTCVFILLITLNMKISVSGC